MQNIYATDTTFHPAMMPPGTMRLNWLLFENRVATEHSRQFRCPAHEMDMAMMKRPLTAQTVYQWLGLMLGMAPPAMIFAKLFQYGLRGYWFGSNEGPGMFFLLLMMNGVCALMGFVMGRALSGSALSVGRKSRSKMFIFLALLGLAWGAATGGSGGLFFFGFGALFGALFAIPIGIAAFVVFGALHRWLERGGMMEARQFWPIAVGIVGTITMLIASA
jgi:hypothetical protein